MSLKSRVASRVAKDTHTRCHVTSFALEREKLPSTRTNLARELPINCTDTCRVSQPDPLQDDRITAKLPWASVSTHNILSAPCTSCTNYEGALLSSLWTMARDSQPDGVTNAPQPRKYRGFRSLASKFSTKRNLNASTAEPPDDSDPSRFCSTCKIVDWDSVVDYKSSLTLSARKVLHINLIDTSGCQFCDLLARSSSQSPCLARYDLLVFRVDPAFTPLLGTAEALAFGLVPEWNFGIRSYNDFACDVIFKTSESTAQILRPIQPLVNLTQLKGWLDVCIDWHTNSCRPSRLETDNLYVINCMTRDVVAHPMDAPCVTLSYVWGRTHEDNSTSDHSWPETLKLTKDMPRTIEDAILVTLELGYQ